MLNMLIRCNLNCFYTPWVLHIGTYSVSNVRLKASISKLKSQNWKRDRGLEIYPVYCHLLMSHNQSSTRGKDLEIYFVYYTPIQLRHNCRVPDEKLLCPMSGGSTQLLEVQNDFHSLYTSTQIVFIDYGV